MLAGLDIILIFISVVCGAGIGYYIRKQRALQATNSAEAKAEKIVTEAKAKEKELLIKAQEKAIATIDEAKKEEQRRYREVNELQKRLEKRETTFSQKLLELQDKQQQLYDKVNQVEEAKERIKNIQLADEIMNCAVTPAESFISLKIIFGLKCQLFLCIFINPLPLYR